MKRQKQSRRPAQGRRISNGAKPPVRQQYLRANEKSAALDGGVLTAAAVLISLGIVMSYSATAPLALDTNLPPLLLDHLAGLAIGLFAAVIAMSVPLRIWQKLALPLWGIGVLLLVCTLLFGIEVNGAKRWLAVPGIGFRFQPVEIAKCATILAVALLSTPYATSKTSFQAVCGNPLHRRCVLTKSRNKRPLGLLCAWLAANDCETKAEHWDAEHLQPSAEERRIRRTLLAVQEDGALLLAKEPDKLPGADSEPE